MRKLILRLGGVLLAGLMLGPAGNAAPASAAGAGCAGAVVRTVDVAQAGPLARQCVAVGGVVRLVNIGPGSLTTTPDGAVDCFYAGGTYSCRLIRVGALTMTLAPDARRLAVTVPARVPGQPSTACAPAGSVVDLNTNDELGWWAPCLRLGATLRIVNLGPGELSAVPAGAVRCRYEAGIHACRFLRTASVAFTAGDRSVTAVAVR